MKWYFWVLIIVVVLIIIFVVRYKMTNKKPSKLETQILNGDYGDILNDNLENTAENSKKIVQDIINISQGDFGKVKGMALNKGILVLRSTEAHTMEYNPKRVIIEEIVINCIKAPCPILLQIQSVG